MKSVIESLEQAELIQKLKKAGYSKLVKALMDNRCYTKKARLNKSGACRVLGWKPKQLEDALSICKEILKKDLD